MNPRVACIGVGMTRFVHRAKESPGELAAHAVQMALEDAGLNLDDIDAVCLGTAPDAFDGVHMNGEHLIAGAGGVGKPYMRHYVGGGTGVMSPIHGWMHVASGKFDTCLVVAEEKMSPCMPHPAGAFVTIFDRVTEQPLELTLIHIFALEMARFMHVYGYTEEEIARVSVMNKANALDHPAAQIAERISVEDVMNSRALSWPVKRLDISPTSDGAVAIVLCNERLARARKAAPVFIDGVGFRLDTAYWCTRDLAFPEYVAMAARDAYQMAGISDPLREIDVFEPYDPFDYKALHHMNALLLDRSGKKVKELLLSGAFERDGSHPMCPSGGALGVGNPIAATGLMKIAELYYQLSGSAGKRQVAKPVRRGVAQAWGDLMQVGTVVVMSADGAPPAKNITQKPLAKNLPATGLKGNARVPTVTDSPNLRYLWDNGRAITTYLEGFKKGKIRGSFCDRCGRMMIPARSFCEICDLSPVEEYFDLPDTGRVMTYTLSYINWDSSPLPKGETNIFAVIAIDGVGDHIRLLKNSLLSRHGWRGEFHGIPKSMKFGEDSKTTLFEFSSLKKSTDGLFQHSNMGLVHRLGRVKPEDVAIGMRVKAVWKKKQDREGAVTDIEYFAPYRGGRVPVEPRGIKPVEMRTDTAGATPGRIPLNYRYTAGIGGTRFFEDLKKGRLSGVWSDELETLIIPPTLFDEFQMDILDLKDTVTLDGSAGVIQSFTRVHEDRSGEELKEPVFIVQVSYPGAFGSVFGRWDEKSRKQPEIGGRAILATSGKIGGPDDVIFRSAAGAKGKGKAKVKGKSKRKK